MKIPEDIEVIVKLKRPNSRPAVEACAARIGVSLQPLHPSTSDSELSTYFHTHVDPAALDLTLEKLRECEGVDGAYAKPRGDIPATS
jgi:hypothetical protein